MLQTHYVSLQGKRVRPAPSMCVCGRDRGRQRQREKVREVSLTLCPCGFVHTMLCSTGPMCPQAASLSLSYTPHARAHTHCVCPVSHGSTCQLLTTSLDTLERERERERDYCRHTEGKSSNWPSFQMDPLLLYSKQHSNGGSTVQDYILLKYYFQRLLSL